MVAERVAFGEAVGECWYGEECWLETDVLRVLRSCAYCRLRSRLEGGNEDFDRDCKWDFDGDLRDIRDVDVCATPDTGAGWGTGGGMDTDCGGGVARKVGVAGEVEANEIE